MPRQMKHPAGDATRVKLLRPGIHVAPFLSPNGRLVLLAIDRKHYCCLSAEVTGLSGRGAFCEGGCGCVSEWLLEPCPSQGDQIPFLNPGNAGPGRRALSRLLLPGGVHVAPWCILIWDDAARRSYKGEILLAIDKRHRLVAQMTALPGQRESARRELSALLDAPADNDDASGASPADRGYIDPYDDGKPDDCCGEDWKH